MRPWLWIPTEIGHSLAPWFLKLHGAMVRPKTYNWKSFDWRGMHFANPLGLAAGMDKNATQVKGWWSFGAGFLEIGTVTPEPQGPNPGRVIARDISRLALWNRLGFPSEGMLVVRQRLEILKSAGYHTPLFINIGKNRATSLDGANKDYVRVFQELRDLGDAFVLNVSSPNTEGLRALESAAYLREFLKPILDVRGSGIRTKPMLIKLSPDMPEAEFKSAIAISGQMGIDGWVLTNTTRAREDGIRFPVEGGASGRPVAERSKQALKWMRDELGSSGKLGRLVVSAGGVMTAADVNERMELGADLVQVYTALIFEGPVLFGRIANLHQKKTID